ncbi:hypothetical protein BH20VER1_BH20VER1_07100 [soil metagenome]
MNWFQQNRFLGTFLAVFGALCIAALVFLFQARSKATEARAQFDQTAMELNRLQRLTPFPNEPNLVKMRTQAEDYSARLERVKEELKTRTLPVVPMAPNEFQVRLRQAMASVAERARANKVTLPENFFLGFDEFAAALPATEAAPLLGQQLAQVELLVGIMIDARVEAITSLRRVPDAPAPTPTPGPRRPPNAPPLTPAIVERSAIEASFLSTPAAARRVINQVSTAQQQLYIVRALHVLNEKDEGPSREAAAAEGVAAAPSSPGAAGAGKTALNFIVGNERVQTSARIEMLRLAF